MEAERGRQREVGREGGNSSEQQASLRASVLAFREDNDGAESTSLSALSISQTLQENKDKLVPSSYVQSGVYFHLEAS